MEVINFSPFLNEHGVLLYIGGGGGGGGAQCDTETGAKVEFSVLKMQCDDMPGSASPPVLATHLPYYVVTVSQEFKNFFVAILEMAIPFLSQHAMSLYLKFWPPLTMYQFNFHACIREYGSTLYVGLSRFPHRANTNRFRCNSLARNFRSFSTYR